MFVSEISLWGAALVACVVIVASIVLAFFDRKMLWPVSVAMLVGSIVVGGSAMLCLPLDSPSHYTAQERDYIMNTVREMLK